MKDNFTEQQREIVARKMGFEGPMQNFGEFLMSSPAAAGQYGAVASKLGQKAPGFAVGGAVSVADTTKSYVDRLKETAPDAYAKLAKAAQYTANENFGGKIQDYQAQLLTPLVTEAPKTIDIAKPPEGVKASSYRDSGGDGGDVAIYTKDLGVINGIPVRAIYDANGTLTGYEGDQRVRTFLDGSHSISGKWDAAGNATPQQYSSSGGGFLKNTLSGIAGGIGDLVGGIATDIKDAVVKARDPLEAAAVLAGNYLVPGSGMITSQLVSDNAKEILASDAGKIGMIGSGLAGASAGNTLGNAGARLDAATASTGTSTVVAGSTVDYGLSAPADSGLGLKATVGEGINLGGGASPNLTDMGGAQGLTMAGGASANLESMGGGQGLTGAAAGGGVLGATGVNTGAAASAGGLPSTPSSGLKTSTTGDSTTTSALDDSAFYASILGLLKNRYDKYSETKTELGLAQGGDVKGYSGGGAVEPNAPVATPAQAVTTTVTPDIQAAASTAGAAQQAVTPTPVVAQTTAAPTAVAAPTITAATSQPAMTAAMQATQAEQGVLSAQDLATAATQAPTTTALAGVQAAQGQATNVVAPAARSLQAGETVTGTAVEQPKVEAALAKNVAAQGTVTAEMTTQGQLNNMLAQFDAKNPPAWAAGTMRTAMAQLAARGLGASSLAGQAVVQAALEAATPIAAADAKVFEQMGLTNLSNRQQMAVLTGQQRAAFLGQEFDQNFQSRVINAAKISDIANKNFDAATTIALENARITNSMDVANLSARQAVVMANAAQMANLETTNLNNRQQVAVDNAKSFLQMDLTNLSNKQQTTLFKSQEIAQSILTDTAAENAAKAVNATNALDAAKVNAQLALTASQFNAAEGNKISLANSAMATDVLKFNAQEANDRADFNANMVTQINMANAKILADVSTANTRETNAMNAVNAKNATDMSAAAYAQLSQTYRDQLEMSWKTGDNELSRANAISVATITSSATIKSAQLKADGDFAAAMGTLVAKIGTSPTTNGGTVFGDLVSSAKKLYDKLTDTTTP